MSAIESTISPSGSAKPRAPRESTFRGAARGEAQDGADLGQIISAKVDRAGDAGRRAGDATDAREPRDLAHVPAEAHRPQIQEEPQVGHIAPLGRVCGLARVGALSHAGCLPLDVSGWAAEIRVWIHAPP
jgi:hypothetical protein